MQSIQLRQFWTSPPAGWFRRIAGEENAVRVKHARDVFALVQKARRHGRFASPNDWDALVVNGRAELEVPPGWPSANKPDPAEAAQLSRLLNYLLPPAHRQDKPQSFDSWEAALNKIPHPRGLVVPLIDPVETRAIPARTVPMPAPVLANGKPTAEALEQEALPSAPPAENSKLPARPTSNVVRTRAIVIARKRETSLDFKTPVSQAEVRVEEPGDNGTITIAEPAAPAPTAADVEPPRQPAPPESEEAPPAPERTEERQAVEPKVHVRTSGRWVLMAVSLCIVVAGICVAFRPGEAWLRQLMNGAAGGETRTSQLDSAVPLAQPPADTQAPLDGFPPNDATAPLPSSLPLPPDVSAQPLAVTWNEGQDSGTLRLSRGSHVNEMPFRAFNLPAFRPVNSSSAPLEIPRVFIATRKVIPADWTLVMGQPPASARGGSAQDTGSALTNINWDEAQSFLAALASAMGAQASRVRLPWEWEWEAIASSTASAAFPDIIGPTGEWTGDAWNKNARDFPILGNAGDPIRRSERVFRGVLSNKDRDYTLRTSFHEVPSRSLPNCGFRLCIDPTP